MTHKEFTKGEIEQILLPYGASNVESFRLLSGGSENTNYLVKTLAKAYVVTISEQKSVREAEELVALLDYFSSNNFASSKVVKTLDGQAISLWQDKPVMVKKYLEGDIVEDIPKKLLTYLGEELAKLHLLSAPRYLPTELSYGVEKFDEVKVYAEHSDFFKWLKQTQAYIESFISEQLPKTMIHSDIFADNIVVSKDGNTATIMDFEEARYYYRVFDIGMMIIGTCQEEGKVSLAKANSLLAGYRRKITLESCEIKALQAFTIYGATATAFWRHQNFNYVNFDPAMTDHYQAMMDLAIYVFGLDQEYFKQELGLV